MTRLIVLIGFLCFSISCIAGDYRYSRSTYIPRYGSAITSSRPNSYRSYDYYSSGRLSIRGIGTSNGTYYIHRGVRR